MHLLLKLDNFYYYSVYNIINTEITNNLRYKTITKRTINISTLL